MLVGRPTVRRIMTHSERIADHLAKLANRLRQEGRPIEAEYLRLAVTGCRAAAANLAVASIRTGAEERGPPGVHGRAALRIFSYAGATKKF